MCNSRVALAVALAFPLSGAAWAQSIPAGEDLPKEVTIAINRGRPIADVQATVTTRKTAASL